MLTDKKEKKKKKKGNSTLIYSPFLTTVWTFVEKRRLMLIRRKLSPLTLVIITT